MRTIILTLALLMGAVVANGQKLLIGERAPEMKIKGWAAKQPQDNDKARLVCFFHSSSALCKNELPALDKLAVRYAGSLNVILIAKEPADKVTAIIKPAERTFYTAFDDSGKTFGNFGVQFVPYSVLIDGKGKVTWFGNPSALSGSIIDKAIK
jgi:hypothetical protein